MNVERMRLIYREKTNGNVEKKLTLAAINLHTNIKTQFQIIFSTEKIDEVRSDRMAESRQTDTGRPHVDGNVCGIPATTLISYSFPPPIS